MSVGEYSSLMRTKVTDLPEWHHSLGRWIRNTWGLWQDSELKKDMEARGFTHADDMSQTIIEYCWSQHHQVFYDLQEAADQYKQYWSQYANKN